MPSVAYREWATTRASALAEIEQAHSAVGGATAGRRSALRQVNHSFAVLLAAHFQGYCRDLHSECAVKLIAAAAPSPPPGVLTLLKAEFTRGRQLDRGNAQPSSLGADFGRLGIRFWDQVERYDPQTKRFKGVLFILNEWRNAIAHQDFTQGQPAVRPTLRFARVKSWRAACQRLAMAVDTVMGLHVRTVTGVAPW